MGSKSFGIKQMGIVGSGNTSVLGSNADLKLNATGQVAITTNTTIAGVVTATAFVGDGSGLTGITTGGGGSVPANLTATTLNVSGITTSGSFVTDLIDGSGTSRGFCTRYYVTANGASAYRFAGPGQRNTVDNPSLYLMRGFTYMFENSTGTSHPFRIQFTGTSTGVGTYVSGDQNGVQIFTIPHDAPASYEYICTIHPGMKGNFIIPS
jgi:plastocyanin